MSDPQAAMIVVAAIAGAHGVRGDVKIRAFTDDPADCFAYGPLVDETGEVSVTPKRITHQKDAVFIVAPEENRTREEWEAMKGRVLLVPREALPEPDDDEFYIEDLIGMDVVHRDGRELGQVFRVHNFGADDLLELSLPDGASWMLPFTRAAAPEVDIASRKIIAEPDGAFLPEQLQLPGEAGEDELPEDNKDGAD